MKKVVLVIVAAILGYKLAQYIFKKKSVDDSLDDVEYINPEVFATADDIDIPID